MSDSSPVPGRGLKSAMKPGSTLRFRIQDAQRELESSTWSIVTSKNSGDVYISGRDYMGELKISLHESGRNRLAWTSAVAESMVPLGADRVITRWDSGVALTEGWSLALRLEIPDSALSQILPPLHPKPTETIAAVGSGRVYVIRVLVAALGAGTLELSGDSWAIVGQMVTGDGRTVVVTVWDEPTTDELEEIVLTIREQALREGARDRMHPRCTGWGYDKDSGIAVVIDAGDPRSRDDIPSVVQRYEGSANITVSPRAEPSPPADSFGSDAE